MLKYYKINVNIYSNIYTDLLHLYFIIFVTVENVSVFTIFGFYCSAALLAATTFWQLNQPKAEAQLKASTTSSRSCQMWPTGTVVFVRFSVCLTMGHI